MWPAIIIALSCAPILALLLVYGSAVGKLCRYLETRYPYVWLRLGKPRNPINTETRSDRDDLFLRFCLDKEYLELKDPEITRTAEKCRLFFKLKYLMYGLAAFGLVSAWVLARVFS